MKIYSYEYKSKTLTELTNQKDNIEDVLTFDKQSTLVSYDVKYKYYNNNNDEYMIEFLNANEIQMIIHQDGERDIYFCL